MIVSNHWGRTHYHHYIPTPVPTTGIVMVVVPGTVVMRRWIVLMLLLVNILMAAVVLPLTPSLINRLSGDGVFLAVDVSVEGGPRLEGLLLPSGCGGVGGGGR